MKRIISLSLVLKDSPSVPLRPRDENEGSWRYKEVKVMQESFEMYIMFLPDGRESRYVPTKVVGWTWTAQALLSNGTWSAVGTSTAAPSVETSVHPKWSKNVEEIGRAHV